MDPSILVGKLRDREQSEEEIGVERCLALDASIDIGQADYTGCAIRFPLIMEIFVLSDNKTTPSVVAPGGSAS